MNSIDPIYCTKKADIIKKYERTLDKIDSCGLKVGICIGLIPTIIPSLYQDMTEGKVSDALIGLAALVVVIGSAAFLSKQSKKNIDSLVQDYAKSKEDKQ